MPPRRTTRTQPAKLPEAAQLNTASIKPEPSPPAEHTLVSALEHIPPLPTLSRNERDTTSSEEALTPISSEAEDDVQAAVDEAVDRSLTKRKRAIKKDLDYDDGSELSAPESEQSEAPAPKRTPKKKVTPRKPKVIVEDEAADENAGETPKKAKKATPKKSRIAKDQPEFDAEGNEIVKKKRKVKEYPKKVYDIPDVVRKETTFKGRLGYACLNTVLRSTKPDSIFCSRTCRIASIEEEGMELPKGLALLNVRDLSTMIEWNEQNKIRFMRMSSEMFPFASHAKYGYDLAFADEGLKAAGALAKKYGHRLTMHPGQFTQLGSPRDAVVEASIRELNYQCEIMDRMEIGVEGVMIIHMGGIYGDKESTLARFKENYTTRLSENVKRRLVLENDEICYNVDDIYPLCKELEIPIIFDYHHDWIYPSAEPPSVLIPKIAEIWKKRGIPMKQHLSEPRPGAESVMERRAHADRCQALPPDLPDDVDLMIEAKDKEQAVFELYRIYGLEDVIHDNLRPADPNPGMHTKGRKSSLKKKQKETGKVDSEGEPIQLSDIEKEGDGGVGDTSVVNGHVKNAINDPGMKVDAVSPVKGKGKGKGAAKTPRGKRKSGASDPDPEAEQLVKLEAEGDAEVARPTTTPKKGGRGKGKKAVEVKAEDNKENEPASEEQPLGGEQEDVKPPPKKKGRTSKGKAT